MNKIISYIPTNEIIPNTYQPRKYFDEESIEELAQSIKVYGIIQPLSVRQIDDKKYELVAGERRLRAAKKLELSQVPVVVINVSDSESAAIALLENLQREDLNCFEEAEAYYNLIKKHFYTQEKLADAIGKKQSTIANKIRLLKLPVKVREKIIENNLTERHSRALLQVDDEHLQLKILDIVIENKLNVKKTEELIKKEIFKETEKDLAKDGKKRIKGIFTPRVYMNTVKQVFDKYGVKAKYNSKDLDDKIQITITIPKK